jgi:hypothetical protein
VDKLTLLKYNDAMPKEESAISPTTPLNLEVSVAELTTVLIEHAKHIERHIIVMESLTRALKQLDATVKKEVSLESSQPSVELREAITSFLEHTVNPKYYQDTGYLRLAGPEARTRDTGKKSKHQKAQ